MIVDLRDQLARAEWEIGRHEPKRRLLFHWAGSPVRQSRAMLDTIQGFARYHIDKDWNPDLPGVQGGDGLHYHFVLGENVVYQARDLDSVLWASGTDANFTAWHALFPIGEGQSPSPGMYRAAAWLRTHLAVPAGGHRDEGTSFCPGDEIAAWIERPQEDEMTAEEREREFVVLTQKHITPTIVAMKAAYDPLVDAARENGLVDEAQEPALLDVRSRLDRIAEAAGAR